MVKLLVSQSNLTKTTVLQQPVQQQDPSSNKILPATPTTLTVVSQKNRIKKQTFTKFDWRSEELTYFMGQLFDLGEHATSNCMISFQFLSNRGPIDVLSLF